MKNTYLVHYASEYYDPVKAHEYYEQHKKLKGRRLNAQGQQAKEYITAQINDRKTAAAEKAKQDIEDARTKRDDAVKDSRSQTSVRTAMLYQQLLSMSKEEMKLRGNQIMAQIKSLKKENADEKQKAYDEYSKAVESTRTELANTRQKLSDDLQRELNGLLADDEMSEETGSKSKGKSAGDGSSSKLTADQKKRINSYVEHMKEKQSNKS